MTGCGKWLDGVIVRAERQQVDKGPLMIVLAAGLWLMLSGTTYVVLSIVPPLLFKTRPRTDEEIDAIMRSPASRLLRLAATGGLTAMCYRPSIPYYIRMVNKSTVGRALYGGYSKGKRGVMVMMRLFRDHLLDPEWSVIWWKRYIAESRLHKHPMDYIIGPAVKYGTRLSFVLPAFSIVAPFFFLRHYREGDFKKMEKKGESFQSALEDVEKYMQDQAHQNETRKFLVHTW
ncbi:unnamed protein product [Vitrella brassicaformis CCMP3155]|uniref:Uncharacterized protein n=1 Tax=Vitrella brassicaformis (strain CCMP3155) TaxID=1169540 RepID=A0A0G4FXC7_VITBC|nr:unnamed protein product [Vitrella brassicaformis CCMP3155]|eukprot:CEM19512.1 unnamed protein product [Vitrella brassicaformis CCMP3155]